MGVGQGLSQSSTRWHGVRKCHCARPANKAVVAAIPRWSARAACSGSRLILLSHWRSQMNQRAWWAMGLCVSSLLVIGCQPADAGSSDEGNIGEVRQAQCPVNPDKLFTHYRFEIDESPVFDLLVIGPEDADTFD